MGMHECIAAIATGPGNRSVVVSSATSSRTTSLVHPPPPSRPTRRPGHPSGRRDRCLRRPGLSSRVATGIAAGIIAGVAALLGAGCSSASGEAIIHHAVPVLVPLGPDALEPTRFPIDASTRTAAADAADASTGGPLIR